ncbi:MAG TPA: Gfo/Idh/MocA family oxidoreductase [Chitinophagaceae bacterium]|nr:Gfo/Idh/MocA family oxidoreductase [Chitinophagaceae bacterium]
MKKNDRRKFLADAAKATLVFTIVPRFVLGGKGYRAPSDQINLGFIGTGKQGRGLLNSFADKTQIIAGADADSKKLSLFQSLAEKKYAALTGKSEYRGFKGYADFQEILQRKDIDAVVIATPDHWHAVHTVMAANAGKHVYCEKPLAHSIEEGRAMVNVMKKNKKVLQTGSMQRSWKNFRQACELVRNGYIGAIKEVLVNVGDAAVPCNLGAEPIPGNVNWEAWVGPAPFKPFNAELSPPVEKDIFPNWRLYKEYGGGMVSDWGAHMFDIAQWGLGMDATGPVKILPPEGNATKGLVLVYENGIRVKHEDFGRKYGVRFIGEKGKIDISRDYLDSDPVNIATATIQPNEIHLYNSPDHYTDWLDCIKTGKQPICDAETGHRTSSVCCLTNIGYWLRKPLDWDPVKEQFTNSPEANQLVKANIRGKWKLR